MTSVGGSYVHANPDANYFIRPGECLISPNKEYIAVLQTDGNFVVYPSNHLGDPRWNMWNSKTAGNPNAGLLVQQDGHFVIYRDGGITRGSDGKFNGDPAQAIFVSNASSMPFAHYYLVMQNDSNFVLYRGTPPGTNLVSVWTRVPGKGGTSICTWTCNDDPSVGRQCQQICRNTP